MPYIDLTTMMLGIGEMRGEMECFTRERCVVAGVEEVARIAKNLGCEVEPLYCTGDRVDPEGIIMRVNGSAAQLHQVWKVGFGAFVDQLPRICHRCLEKKLFVEANARQARVLAGAGVDGIQFDKISPEQLETLVPELRDINPRVTLVAAGGINPDNAADYAATGIDGLVTASLFTAKPLDMSVRTFALD